MAATAQWRRRARSVAAQSSRRRRRCQCATPGLGHRRRNCTVAKKSTARATVTCGRRSLPCWLCPVFKLNVQMAFWRC
eukprot:2822574-Rhodomonas_salina.1